MRLGVLVWIIGAVAMTVALHGMVTERPIRQRVTWELPVSPDTETPHPTPMFFPIMHPTKGQDYIRWVRLECLAWEPGRIVNMCNRSMYGPSAVGR